LNKKIDAMRGVSIKCVPIFLLQFFVNFSFAQVKPATATIFTADSIQSGNTKDILTNFFQLAFNNLSGPKKEFNFSSNPFAIMLKRNPALSLDKTYRRYKPLRKLNFNLGVRLDSAFNFNGLSSGIKYSLIDETDATTSKFISLKLHNDPLGLERDILTDALNEYQANNIPLQADKIIFLEKLNQLMQQKALNKFDTEFQNIVKGIIKEKKLAAIAEVVDHKPGQSFRVIDSLNYAALKNSIKNNLLWTIGVSDSTYKDKFQLANVVIVSELSKGIFDPEPGDNNLEINIKAAYNFLQDTVKPGRNLKREIFSVEPGINWVIRDRTTDRSFCELKFSGSFYHNFASLYPNEKRDSLTLNGTLRVRIVEDVWIPLEIRYDPKTGNIFGFLNIRANFTGLGKFLKRKVG
jgi:hypothetical protein